MENQKYTRCFCRSVLLHSNIPRHLLSKRHNKMLEIAKTVSDDKIVQEIELFRELDVDIMETPGPKYSQTGYNIHMLDEGVNVED